MSMISGRPQRDGWQETAVIGRNGRMRHRIELDPDDPWSPEIEMADGRWHVYVPRPVGRASVPPLPWAPGLLPGARLSRLVSCDRREEALGIARDWLARVDG